MIDAADAGTPYRRMDGPTRAMAYRVAASTGFRAEELRSLSPASFLLDGPNPSIILPPKATKNRMGADQPIPRALAVALVPFLASKPTGRSVFPLPTYEAAKMMRANLKVAGIDFETALPHS